MPTQTQRKTMKIIGSIFRQIREAQNLKREYIAQKCGVSYESIAKMEQGNVDVGIGRFTAYLEALGLNLQQFAVYLPPPPQTLKRALLPIKGCCI